MCVFLTKMMFLRDIESVRVRERERERERLFISFYGSRQHGSLYSSTTATGKGIGLLTDLREKNKDRERSSCENQ